MLIFLLSLLVNICLKEKWLTESWGPYQLDQFGLGKVYIFPQKCVFAEEMCFWIPVVSLNKNNKRIEAKIKLRWSSLIKILNWEYEVHITKCKVVSWLNILNPGSRFSLGKVSPISVLYENGFEDLALLTDFYG